MEHSEIVYYNLYLNQLKIISDTLEQKYNSNNLFDSQVGSFHMFRSIVINLTFLSKNHESSSFTTFTTLSRMIIDNYATFFLLTSNNTKEEQELRYALYFIDSLKCRIKTTTDFAAALKNIPQHITELNKKAIENDEMAIEKFSTKIYSENLNILVGEKVIEKNQWKFQSVKPAKNGNSYSWEELYQIAKIPKHFSSAIQNHFSQFTHGLALSILYNNGNPESKESILGILNIVQMLLGKIMLERFNNDLKKSKVENRFIEACNYHWNSWK